MSLQIPEVAFTADTTAELFERADVESADLYRDLYRAKLLIVELTFLDDSITVEQACSW